MLEGHQLFEIIKSMSLVAVPITMYLAWTKIGRKVAAYSSWGMNRTSAPGIDSVTLMNLKDKSLVVFAIHATVDDLSIPLREFKPPLILKGMEAIRVEIDPVSEYVVGGDNFEFDFLVTRDLKFNIYIDTISKTIKCQKRGPSHQFLFAKKRNLRHVMPLRNSFNGRIYGSMIKYAIVYRDAGNKTSTAFIDDVGVIDWGISPNMLQRHQITSEISIEAALKQHGVGALIEPFFVTRLPPP